ncbi:UDP-glycosyltransferase UGT5-like isoform X2 [Homalodisca vitripennis]|uniref:UDP-glycosyltransferase UGT5-like isoform X2 n=1 Tax=Homalodisca vitripennis TaxID=197043 RepID=UPI001EEC365D|nr:UDP-glycosyltransferase UGT5-like isoform X2 [Homalodisca vitripennis]
MFKLLVFSCLFGHVLSANILAVFPHTGKSHFDVFEPLVLALAGRGHQVTVLSFYPQKTPVANYTDISLVGTLPVFVNALQFDYLKGSTLIFEFTFVNGIGLSVCESVLTSPQVKSLISSGKKFDLLLVELFNSDCFLSLVDFFSAPHIGLSSSMNLPHHIPRVGNPDSFSFSNNILLPIKPPFSFLQRLQNVVYTLGMRLGRTHYYSVLEQKPIRQVFGHEVDLERVAHNVSLVMTNTHYSLQGARPLVPGYIEVGGLHILPLKPIVKDLDKYLNESTEGAILFSMGSVLQSSSFPPAKRQAIMDAFAELPVRVVMKWEDDTLPGKPDNVRLSKWLPQRDILAHPKIVAFMGHGGLLSTSEAVYCGIPMVLIPMFGDQPNNVAHLAASGAAVKLSYNDITKETVLKALRAVLYDSRYKESAKLLSERFRDRPMSPLDTAVYWTEYVLRHNGARHLRSAAVDMPWYQLWLLDVALVLLAGLASVLFVVFWLARRVANFISRRLYPHQLRQKQKRE